MQVLVIPFRLGMSGELEYALLRRADEGYWQPIAGGGEDDETPEQAARRESFEEAGIDSSAAFHPLQATTMIPVTDICGFLWGEKTLVIPQYCFAVRVASAELTLSREHTEYRWFSCDEALRVVRWDGNRTAIWELHHRLTHGMLES
jgi:dATP pyrophosphohydrolase